MAFDSEIFSLLPTHFPPILLFLSSCHVHNFPLIIHHIHSVQYSALPYPSTPLHSTPLYSTLLYSTPLHSTLLYSTPLHSTLLYSTLLYSTLLYSTLLYSTLFHSHYTLYPLHSMHFTSHHFTLSFLLHYTFYTFSGGGCCGRCGSAAVTRARHREVDVP